MQKKEIARIIRDAFAGLAVPEQDCFQSTFDGEDELVKRGISPPGRDLVSRIFSNKMWRDVSLHALISAPASLFMLTPHSACYF